MISKNLKIGSRVFNIDHGFGYFLGWHDASLEIAIVKFEYTSICIKDYLKRKDLTEVIEDKK